MSTITATDGGGVLPDDGWIPSEDVVLGGPIGTGSDGLVCVLNAGSTPVPLPEGELLITSAPVDGELPANSAVWLR